MTCQCLLVVGLESNNLCITFQLCNGMELQCGLSGFAVTKGERPDTFCGMFWIKLGFCG